LSEVYQNPFRLLYNRISPESVIGQNRFPGFPLDTGKSIFEGQPGLFQYPYIRSDKDNMMAEEKISDGANTTRN